MRKLFFFTPEIKYKTFYVEAKSGFIFLYIFNYRDIISLVEIALGKFLEK